MSTHAFQHVTDKLTRTPGAAGVTTDVFGRVLTRVLIRAPEPVSQVDIARGRMLHRPTEIAPASVSRAVKALVDVGLLTRHPVLGPGRPVVPLTLGSDRWALIGVHVDHRKGAVRGAFLTLTELTMAGTPLAEISHDFAGNDVTTIAKEIAQRVQELVQIARDQEREVLGVGVELGGHVADGAVVAAARAGMQHVQLGQELARLVGLPVVIENDVNARAVRESYRHEFPERDFALVGVFREGVGGAIVLDGRLHRGAGGAAGEIGHVTAALDGDELPGFGEKCSCGKRGHVECLATTSRIEAALQGLAPGIELDEAGSAASLDEEQRLTPEARVFRHAGIGLGRGIAALANLLNPGRILLLLPPVLANPRAGTAAENYLSAVEATLNEAFSTAATDARAHEGRLRVMQLDPDAVAADGARAAALCVLNAFIEELRGKPSTSANTPADYLATA